MVQIFILMLIVNYKKFLWTPRIPICEKFADKAILIQQKIYLPMINNITILESPKWSGLCNYNTQLSWSAK